MPGQLSRPTPLAVQLRPQRLDEVIGQTHLIGSGMPIRKMADKKKAISTILWGPPGTGKTTLVRALSRELDALFYAVNATSATVKELRDIILAANTTTRTVFVFVDEIHRFSKSQQDVLLPVVEDGTITLFGATTEKPKFAVNSTILSRCIVLETTSLSTQQTIDLIKRVKSYYKANNSKVVIDPEAAKLLITRCSGDARKVITSLETCIEVLSDDKHVTVEMVNRAIPDKHLVFDAHGNEHFDLAHCYQEAIQNSDTDGALYWLGKWLSSGEDPAYICRRMLITSFEDCAGNPFAWLAAMAASYTVEKTGMPECMIPMALATCEMGKSRRNKSAYSAIRKVMDDIEKNMVVHVPPELRAGTSGYVKAVQKRYLDRWEKDYTLRPSGPSNDRVESDPLRAKANDEILYAAGTPKDHGSYGMYAGPTPSLESILNTIGEDGDVIFKFDPMETGDQSERVIYKCKSGEWKEV